MKLLNAFHLVSLLYLIFVNHVDKTIAMKILAYFPAIARSHHNVFQPLIQGLAKRGHEITYLSPIPLQEETGNVTHIRVPDDAFNRHFLDSMVQYPFYLPYYLRTAYFFGHANMLFTRFFCNSKQIQELAASKESYDLVLHSAPLAQEHALPLIHKFNALGVTVAPIADVAWVNELSGLTDNPSFMMDFQAPSLTDRMDFSERLTATAYLISSLLTSYYFLYRVQSEVDKCFTYEGSESRPSLYQLAKDQALVLTGSHHAVGYAFPRAPHVKEIGGIHIKEPKPLPENLEKFISEGNNGFIYFSLGSLLRTESNEFSRLKSAFLSVFSRRKEKVLFKWEANQSSTLPGNVLISKWFPQQDILASSDIKLFVTHAGFQSIVETVHYGVPIVAIPMFSDQYKNAKMAESKGFGITLDFSNVTEQSVNLAVNEVLSNPKYRREAKSRSNLLRDRPMKPLDEAVYWIEYVHKYGRVLQPASIHLSFDQLHLLDVYAVVGIVIMACVVAARKITQILLTYPHRR